MLAFLTTATLRQKASLKSRKKLLFDGPIGIFPYNINVAAVKSSFRSKHRLNMRKVNVKVNRLQQFATTLTGTGTHMPFGITQRYLRSHPPHSTEVIFPTLPLPVKAGTRFSDRSTVDISRTLGTIYRIIQKFDSLQKFCSKNHTKMTTAITKK